jgi:cytochrome c-type biogenesis protein CcmH
MTFWLVSLALAGAVALLLVLALVRRAAAVTPRSAYDIAVYRDQLAAVEADLARGVITADAADRTRTEVARRILEADRAGGAERAASDPRGLSIAVAAGIAVFLVGGSAVLYLREGVPGYGDLPLKERLAASETFHAQRPLQAAAEAEAAATRPAPPPVDPAHAALVERLRKAMADRPDDPRGFQLLAENEAALGNFVAAYQAQARLIALKGDTATADDYADYAEMMILAAGGYVSPEAEKALGTALGMDAGNAPALYYIGLMEAQVGRPDRTFAIWRQLLEAAPADAPWLPAIRSQIAAVADQAGIPYDPPAPAAGLRGPGAADMAAAAGMAPEAQAEMIRGMVEGLQTRLDANGGTAAEWAQLITALGVLGDSDAARAARDKATTAYQGDAAALEQIAAAAARAGLSP